MEINSKQRTQRWIIALCLLFIIFFSSRIPSPMVRNILVGVPGLVAIVLQVIIFLYQTEKKYKFQGAVLIILSVLLVALSLLA